MNFLKKGIAVSLGQIGGIFLNMLAGIIFARLLGPSGMGQFELFRSSQTVIVTFLALGLGNSSIYFLNNRKTDPKDLVSTTLKGSLVFSLILFVGLFIAVFVFHTYFGAITVAGAFIFALGASALLNSLSLKPVLTAQLASTRMIIVDLLPRITMFVFGGIMLLAGKAHIDVAIAALGVGNLLSFVLLLVYLRHYISLRSRFSWGLFRDLLKYGLKLSASNLLYVLTANVTVMLLRYFERNNFNQVGLYTRAVAISGMVSLVPYTVGPLLYAKWSNMKGEQLSRQAEYAMRISLAFSVFVSVVVFAFSKLIITLMYGAAFAGAADAVRILAPSLVFLSISNICTSMLAGDGKAGITIWIFLGTFSIVTATTWLTVNKLGIEGAALAVLIGNIFTAIVSMIICRRIFQLRLSKCFILRKEDIASVKRSLGITKKKEPYVV